MGTNVKSIDTVKVKEDLKSCPKLVRDYVRSLESLYDSQKYLNAKCIHKVRQLSLENTSLIVSRQTYAKECVKASLEMAAENVKMNPTHTGSIIDPYHVDKQSITSPDNIVLL